MERKTKKVMVRVLVAGSMIVFVVAPRAMVAWASVMETPPKAAIWRSHTYTFLGGSGGGGGDHDPAGAGGGAIELIAHGDGMLSLTTSAKISVNGGDAHRSHTKGGGAGSGGAIRLQGGSISCLEHWRRSPRQPLLMHAGGGGRIAIQTDGNLVLGSIDLSGYRPGTLHISGATATSSLDFSSGTLTFDTTHGYWHHTSGVHGTGVLEQKDDNGIQYKTCTFTFDCN